MDTGNTDSKMLMERVARGDAMAIRQLVDDYGQMLLRQTMRLVPMKEEAEELLHDALLRAIRFAHQYDAQRASLPTWLLRIAYTTCLRHIQRHSRYQTISLDDVPGMADEVSEETLDNAFSTGDEGRIQYLVRALGFLSTEDRTLLALRYEEDRPLTEVAYLFDSTPDALYQRLHRIRRRLYNLIKHFEHADHS
ncbi:MAG: RNA polymerase sigma factor [Bacteroidaceae bacterium]|nr:RNA polymerase sigma factor [Bacteroidaceae bacterium]